MSEVPLHDAADFVVLRLKNQSTQAESVCVKQFLVLIPQIDCKGLKFWKLRVFPDCLLRRDLV